MILNVVSAIITVLSFLFAIYTYYAPQWKERRRKANERKLFWGNPTTNLFTIIYRAYEDPSSLPQNRKNYYVKFQTYSALSLLEDRLNELGFDVRAKAWIKDSTESDLLTTEEKQGNVIFLGSMKAHPDASTMFPEIEEYYRIDYADDKSGYIWDVKQAKKVVSSNLIKDDSDDCILILKFPNRYNPSNYIYNIAGAHADGTFAAALLLVDAKKHRESFRGTFTDGVNFGELSQSEGFVHILSAEFQPSIRPIIDQFSVVRGPERKVHSLS